ncbi:MAG TPA: UDP-N-acetylmuramate--L-alanine ligase [Clostridiales bacterium]|nr:UDP-N-acetylmuramate--L-alanine ligase [Clostridiales bacterium]
MDFTGKRIHMIGVAGSSMSGLASILQAFGSSVQGSDENAGDKKGKLEKQGIRVLSGHSPNHLADPSGQLPHLVVYTAAVKPSNPEIQEARRLGIPVIERKDLLGMIMSVYRFPIAVSGTHGKTTTTSMIASILLDAGSDPGFHIGGDVKQLGGGTRAGNGGFFVTEACEYVDSFLSLRPKAAVVLNIEEDHLDYFKDIQHICRSFRAFVQLLPGNGFLVVNAADPNCMMLAAEAPCRVILFGGKDPNAGYSCQDIQLDSRGYPSFQLVRQGTPLKRLKLHLRGSHNIQNALAAAAVCLEAGCTPDQVAAGLEYFAGASRRFEWKGARLGVDVYDDYAHHPSEISATLDAARTTCRGKIFCIFQPHTYTRAKRFMHGFSSSLSLADQVVLTDIFASRESDPGDVRSEDLLDIMKTEGLNVIYIKDFSEIADFLSRSVQEGDMVLTLGAGDVSRVGELFLSV